MPKSKKKGKAKKGKAKGKGKSKKCCDGQKMTDNMDIKAKMSYLVELGILQDIDRCEPIEFEEFIGDINYIGALQESIDPIEHQPEPTLAHARQFCIQFGALPLGSKFIRQHITTIPAILLYGPPGSGKSFLSQCIAHTTSSRWFDLSPSNILPADGQESTLTTKEISKIMHLTFEMAEFLQPSVIYIDECEKVFIPSKKKAAIDAGKLKKDLLIHAAKITAEKRVLIVGNSSCPFNDNVDFGDFKKFFFDSTPGDQMALMNYIPYPNYLNRQRLWTHFVHEKGLHIEELNRSNHFELSILTLLSEGYTAGSIREAVHIVLTKRRFDKYHRLKKAFTTKEFLQALSKTVYTYKDDQRLFREFTAEVTGRNKFIADFKAKQEAEASGGGDGDGKDKKGKKGKKGKKK